MLLDVSTLNVTFTFVTLAALVPFLLTAWIGLRRGKLGILRGHGDDPDLFLRSRIHGNFVENAPIVGLALFVAEAGGMADVWLWAAVAAFALGRIFHAVRFDHKDRALGMTLTNGPAVALGVVALLSL